MLQEDISATIETGHPPRIGSAELLQALPLAVYVTDASGVITAYNEAAAALWGTRPELGSDKWCGSWRLHWPDGTPLPHDECPMAIALKEDRAINGKEAVAERPDGRLVPFLAFPTPLHIGDGELIGAVNTLVDITEHKKSQQAELLLASIVTSSNDAIVSKDLNGVITTWNQSAQRVFGYAAEEAVGRPVTMLIPSDRMDEEVEILRRIRNGEMVDHFDTIRVRKDGSQFPISLTISPIRDDDGRIVGASKIARDITERKEHEQRIRALMREVNHRVKNQFAVILSMIRETNKRSSSPEQFETQVRERVQALSRSHDLLVEGDWRGATVFELLLSHLQPFGNEELITMSGPALTLQPMAVQYLGIAFHELATNSAKYGALAGRGTVKVEWSVGHDKGERRFRLRWTETSGPRSGPAGEGGFGRVVLERVAPAAIGGKGALDLLPDGVAWSLDAPMTYVEAKGDDADDMARLRAVEDALT